MLPSAKLESVSNGGRANLAESAQWTPSATRADVVRMIARYVRLEFTIRSATGKLVVDETRISSRRVLDDRDLDIEDMSFAEFRDAINTLVLRRAVYARPEAPRHYTHDGQPLYRVVPLRDAVPFVRPRVKCGRSSADGGAREWRGSVAQKLGRLPQEQSDALVEVEHLRLSLKETQNRLEQERRVAGRLKGGGRQAQKLMRHAESRVAELRAQETRDSERLRSLTRSRAYRRGIDRLLLICTESEQVERELLLGRTW